ncbi:MAG: PaaI family thioesterase [Kordiimonadaceae bacterium]|nr:PaaI family thioesterase [Kordiimonadaceae bacterium]
MQPRTATPEMIAESNPPAGYEPIVSWSNFGWENGPIFDLESKDGWVRGFRVLDKHINAGGVCHGGMLMTFADILLSRAVMEVVQPPFVTIRMVTDFVGAGFKGQWLEGTAEVQGEADGVITVTGKVTSDRGTVISCHALFKKIGRVKE